MRTPLIARSRPMRALLAQLKRFADTDANVLILGETGAGKDTIARALHAAGPRRHEPFVEIDCPSLPATLLESELFGHERGAFTDATTARTGRFELAGRGSVYLDRVSELPFDTQAKLLRLVEEKRGERLGGNTAFEIRARIIASVEPGIEERVQDGSFRRDLYHRLSVLPLVVPPLRERVGDILPLATLFLREASTRVGRPAPTLSGDAAAALKSHLWPGNVRELRHVLERAVIGPDGGHPGGHRLASGAAAGHRQHVWVARACSPHARRARAPLPRHYSQGCQGQPDRSRRHSRDQPEGAVGKT
ncbi:MAG: sigma-54-dependent Fis family transcriptional regulator [Acidobacteria bacterium]|nr:sigma-54-dependent Fis family transcriptional regulator [Acidobacteriota bacterium]